MDASNATGWLIGGTLGGVVLGWAATLWGRFKAVFWKALSCLFATVEIKDQPTANAVLAYLLANYKRSRYYDATYGSNYEYMRDGKYGMVSFEDLAGKNLTFWKGWKPMFWGVSTPAPPSGQQQQQTYSWQQSKPQTKTTMFFLHGTFNAKEIIKIATTDRNTMSWDVSEAQKVKRFFIRCIPDPKDKGNDTRYSAGTGVAWYQEPNHLLLTHEASELGRTKPGKKKALDLLVFPQKVKNLINEIVCWRRSRDWYIERGIPWKRGWLLYGPPGTGKTMLVRAFAEDLDLPLFSYSLGELMNNELQKCWEEMQAHTPCIALFEDIDNVFHGRRNVFADGSDMELLANVLTKKNEKEGDSKEEKKAPPKLGKLSFDCLLNCLDGVNKPDGIFVVITTNHVDKVDEAIGRPRKLPDGRVEFISTRPGRIDKAIELTYMTREDKIELAQRILYDCPEGMDRVVEFIDEYHTLEETPAQFQERCSQIALAYYWKSQCESGKQMTADAIEEITRMALMVASKEEPLVEETPSVDETPVHVEPHKNGKLVKA